ncbi:hypothetical protein OG394_03125 [Kribbella sp. NBC_01245]|uniref:hypothetical protein n=1 Tax=Kribbella sp. NBC_01245 TaxID=2903578 RepID=UPI002E2D18BB|nr:hypothetical protein [Kribbella sp. NBC_01245]
MRARLHRILLCAAILTCQLLLPTQAAGDETWNPLTATPAGIPTPAGSGPYYQYAPSVVQLSPTERMVYYCANRVPGQVWDHIGANKGTKQADGSYAWSPTYFALDPQGAGTPRWASRHLCDPEVVRGSFRLAGHTYGWAMFFLGYPDTDRFPGEDPINVIGVAYADAPEGPWRIAPAALLDRRTEGSVSDWGIGQPSATSIDGAGRVLLFYSGLGSVVRREVDLSNADSPQLGSRIWLPTDGLTPEPGGGAWLHNASFVYDPARDEFFVSRDTGPGNDRVQQHTEIDRIAGAAIWSGTGTWSVVGQVTSCLSGYPYNHNSGIVRNAYGMLGDELDVYFATEPTGGGFWSYRLWQARSPLSFVSGSRPEVIAQQDGKLSVFGHTANRCEANVWSSTQATTEYGAWQRFGASPAGRPVASRQPDGRVVLFARAADGSIWFNLQSAPNGGFPGWSQMAGSGQLPAVGEPVVGRMQDGRLVVAIRRNDAPGSRVYVNVQQAANGSFGSSWQDLGASPAGQPVFGTNEDGSLVLFAHAAKESGGQIWFNPQLTPNGSAWGGWRAVEGMAFDGEPTIARQADGRLVVAARRWEGSLSVVYVNTQVAANSAGFSSSWTSLGASPAYDPVLVEQSGGRLAMLARAADGSVWWSHQDEGNGRFSGWSSLGGSAGSDPVAALRSDQRLDVVLRQPDGRLFHRLQTAPGSPTFTDWQPIR